MSKKKKKKSNNNFNKNQPRKKSAVNTAVKSKGSKPQKAKEPVKAKRLPKNPLSFIKEAGKKEAAVYLTGAAIILVLIVFSVLLLCGVFSSPETRAATVTYAGRNEEEIFVRNITLDEEKQHLRSKEMNVGGNKGKFGFYCNNDLNLNYTDKRLPVSFSNPSYNDCTLICTVTDGCGKILYRSLGIEPGKCINNIDIHNDLNIGENKLKLYVTAFENEGDGKSFVKIGNLFTSLNVYVDE